MLGRDYSMKDTLAASDVVLFRLSDRCHIWNLSRVFGVRRRSRLALRSNDCDLGRNRTSNKYLYYGKTGREEIIHYFSVGTNWLNIGSDATKANGIVRSKSAYEAIK